MVQDLATMPYEKGMKVLQIIWGAMIFSVGVYAAIAWMMRTRAMELGAGWGDAGVAMTVAVRPREGDVSTERTHISSVWSLEKSHQVLLTASRELRLFHVNHGIRLSCYYPDKYF